MGEIEKIEQKLKNEKHKDELDRAVSEVPVDNTEVLDILWHNASVSQDSPVEYRSDEFVYLVSFGYAEVQMPDGKTGIFDEMPGMSQRKDVISMTFNVAGFAGNKETEMQFFKNNISVTPERKYRQTLIFQRAVLKKGNI
ncbi:hypothetical protein Thermo_00467 [Thermoplasmatales archaeon]|nr:hypothetical protein Thermo_00467 [Thermoplasmatales archaeon]